MSMKVFQVDPQTGAIGRKLSLGRLMNAGRVQVARLHKQGGFDWLVIDPHLIALAGKLQRQKFSATERDLGLYLYVMDLVRQLEGFPRQPPQCLICEASMLQRLQRAGNLVEYQPIEEFEQLLEQAETTKTDDKVVPQLFALFNILENTIGTRVKTAFSNPTPTPTPTPTQRINP